MNHRRDSANSDRKPMVMAMSRGPNGRRVCSATEGNTTSTRSRKMATRPNTATTNSGPWRSGGRPVRRLSRYTKGISQPTISTTQASVPHGCTKKRRTKKRVSTGTLPYQITRYCDQKKYIHMIDMTNCSLATSWTAVGGMEATPREFARMVRIDSRQNVVYIDVTTK